WGMRDERDLYWTERLEELSRRSTRFAYHVCLSRPEGAWGGPAGRITTHVLGGLAGLERPVFYLVGNGDMVRDVKVGLEARGVDRRRQIRTEIFTPATATAKV